MGAKIIKTILIISICVFFALYGYYVKGRSIMSASVEKNPCNANIEILKQCCK